MPISLRRFLAVLPLMGLLAMALPQASQAQLHTIEISPTFGYLFGGKASGRNAEVSIEDDISYGVQVDFQVRPGGWLELIYLRQDTEAYKREFGAPAREKLSDLGASYWMIGGRQDAPRQGPMTPWVSLTLGATHLAPKDPPSIDYDDMWNFAGILGIGVKTQLGNAAMLQLMGRVIGTSLWSSSSWWCSVPGGCAVGVSGTGFWQGDVSAALTIPLGRI